MLSYLSFNFIISSCSSGSNMFNSKSKAAYRLSCTNARGKFQLENQWKEFITDLF